MILIVVCAVKNIKLCTVSFITYTFVFWSYIAVIIDSCSRAGAGTYLFRLTLRYKLSSAAFYRGLVVSIDQDSYDIFKLLSIQVRKKCKLGVCMAQLFIAVC